MPLLCILLFFSAPAPVTERTAGDHALYRPSHCLSATRWGMAAGVVQSDAPARPASRPERYHCSPEQTLPAVCRRYHSGTRSRQNIFASYDRGQAEASPERWQSQSFSCGERRLRRSGPSNSSIVFISRLVTNLS